MCGFPGAWRRCNFSEWNKPFFVVAPLVPIPDSLTAWAQEP
ncbi:MAG: hypothetical protein WC091_21580 [Sulfuricellaceae bacterium]